VTLQTRAPENFRLSRWGDELTVKRAQTVSEDSHRRERKCFGIHFFGKSLFKQKSSQSKLELIGFYQELTGLNQELIGLNQELTG
jgi:hypothetical protein